MAREAKKIVESYLVTCARTGDKVAREDLVGRFQNRFLRHAHRLPGEAEQARDAVQESWLEILRGLPKLKDDGAFAAWAFRIVTRRCSKQIARAQRTRATAVAVSAEAQSENRSADAIEQASDRLPVRQALAALPADQRAAVALFYLEDMSVAEVAVALDVAAGTVKTRLMHARRKTIQNVL